MITLKRVGLMGIFLSILVIGVGALILNSELCADSGVVGLIASAALKAFTD